MPTKLIVCLLAACCVAGSGAYLYFDTGCSGGGCPLSKMMSSSTSAACDSEGSCCEMSKVAAKKKGACCTEAHSECPAGESAVAVFGGASASK
jgi:hypothetical protein